MRIELSISEATIEHIKSDEVLTISDAICLNETWLWPNEDTSIFNIEGFNAIHSTTGRGKGVTVYFKATKFMHKIQLSKLRGKLFDLVGVY